MKIRKPNIIERMLFSIENELSHLESLAKLMHDAEEREFLYSSIKRMQNLVLLLLENIAECEEVGMTQSQREARVAEYDRAIIPSVIQDMYLEIGQRD